MFEKSVLLLAIGIFPLAMIVWFICYAILYILQVKEKTLNTLAYYSQKETDLYLSKKNKVDAAYDYLLEQKNIVWDKNEDSNKIYWILEYDNKTYIGNGTIHDYEKAIIKFSKHLKRQKLLHKMFGNKNTYER